MGTTEVVAARLDDELDRLLTTGAPGVLQRKAMANPLCLCWPDGDE
jgi:hypothetical protein